MQSRVEFAKSLTSKLMSNDIYKDAVWSIGSTVLDRGGMLLLTVIVARLLGVEALGIFSIVSASILVVVNPFAYALTVASTRRVAETFEHDPLRSISIIIIIFVLCVLIMAVLALPFLIAPDFISKNILNRDELYIYFSVGVVLLCGEFLRKVGVGVFYGVRAFKEIFLSSIVLFVVLISSVVIIGDFGVKAVLVINGAAGTLSFSVCLYLVIKRYLIPKMNEVDKFKFEKDNKLFSSYIFPAFLSSLIPGVIVWYMQVLLIQYGDADEVGLFAASNQIRMLVVFFPVILSSVLVPRMVRKSGCEDGDRSGNINYLFLSLGGGGVIVLVVGVVLSALSPWIASVYGAKFAEHTQLFVIMIWVGCFNGINQSLGSIITSRGSIWIGFISNFVWAALFALMFALWGVDYLAIGMAESMLYSYFVVTLFQVIYVLWISPELVEYVKGRFVEKNTKQNKKEA